MFTTFKALWHAWKKQAYDNNWFAVCTIVPVMPLMLFYALPIWTCRKFKEGTRRYIETFTTKKASLQKAKVGDLSLTSGKGGEVSKV